MSRLVVSGLTRRFPGAERPALGGVDLDVAEGESLVLVGPSGCGKSTLLRPVAGLDEPTGGRISLGGRDLVDVPPQDRDVAMVFQGYALYPHRTARQNVSFPLEMRKVPAADRARRVNEVAELLGIAPLLERFPANLSGGERQRVAIARALVRHPKLFLFDEPLANLDAGLRAELRVELAALVRRLGVTAVFVTHDQAEAMTMGDRIAVLSAGTLQQIGTPRAVYERPANRFVATFLGTPPMNTLPVSIAAGRAVFLNTSVDAPEGAAPGGALIAFRPERAALLDDGAEAESDLTLDGSIHFLEPLGDETIVHVALRAGDGEADGPTVRVRVPGFCDRTRGDSVRVRVPRGALAWFDAAGDTRIDA
jgi:multiple sugar transport system ATP-binding protein